MHVLLIESNVITARHLQHMLQGIGFTSFRVATTEFDAVAAAKQCRPDLITAEILLARGAGSGLTAVRAIRRALGAVPSVFVTSRPELLDGAEPVVIKPFGKTKLCRACEVALGRPAA
jgi:CheY-like chemotaxis protein